MLPPQQEPHQVLGGDGLDLPAQALLGVDVDAGEEPAGAPLLVIDGRVKLPLQDKAFMLELGQRHAYGTFGQTGDGGQLAGRHRTESLEMAADHGDCRGPLRITCQESLDLGAPLDGMPEPSLMEFGDGGPTVPDEVLEPVVVLGEGRGNDQRQQQVVQLVGIPEIGTGLGPDSRNGVGIKGSQIAGLHREAPPEGNGAAPALLKRRIVEERVGPGIEDLVGEW